MTHEAMKHGGSLLSQFQMFIDRPEISKHTRDKYFYRLRPFMRLHGQKTAVDITTDTILQYIDSQNHLSDPSRSILRQSFHAFFAYCGVQPNPAKGLPRYRETPRRVHLPDETAVNAVMETAVSWCLTGSPHKSRDGVIFTLAMVSGNRRGEIRNVTVNELNEAMKEPGEVYHCYTTGKTGGAVLRFLPFHVPLINAYLPHRPDKSPYAFVNLNPHHPQYGQQLSLVALDRARISLCRATGTAVITYQELRRRLATHIARSQGVDIAAHALNHSPHSGDRVIRLFYYDPDKAAVDRAITAVWGK